MAGHAPALFLSCSLLCRGLSIALVSGVLMLAACGPSFQQMAAAECQGIASDVAYAKCVSQQLADQRLGYIVRSQPIGAVR
jgi:hypothetical protein